MYVNTVVRVIQRVLPLKYAKQLVVMAKRMKQKKTGENPSLNVQSQLTDGHDGVIMD